MAGLQNPVERYDLRDRNRNPSQTQSQPINGGDNQQPPTKAVNNNCPSSLQSPKSPLQQIPESIKRTGTDPPKSGTTGLQPGKSTPHPPQNLDREELVEVPVISMEHFKEAEMNDKLDLLMAAINKINTNFHYKFDDLKQDVKTVKASLQEVTPKVKELEKGQEELSARLDDLKSKIPDTASLTVSLQFLDNSLSERIRKLEESQISLEDDMTLLKGSIQVQEQQVQHNKDKILNLTVRSMSDNIIIYGLTPDPGNEEKPRQSAYQFIKDKLSMDIGLNSIIEAHRLGKKTSAKPHPLIIRCRHELRQTIFNYTKNLKGFTNSLGDPYIVKPQLPEPLATQKKECEEHLKSIRKANDMVPEEQKDRKVMAEIRNKTLYINNVPQVTHIHPPTIRDMFEIDAQQQEKIDNLECNYSDKDGEKGSVFQAYGIRVKNAAEVKLG